MSMIKGSNTKPELIVRRYLHSKGFRYTLNNKKLPGKPDIVLKNYSTAIFVHGCFWHRHAGCRYAYTPKSTIEFWQHKFDSNIRRDKQVTEQLKELQWSQLVLWECEIKNPETPKRRIKAFFRDR